MKIYKNGLSLHAIRPECGDMYSKNLYLWIKHLKAGQRERLGVFIHSGMDSYIGEIYDGDFIGSRLTEVLCQGGGAKIWCFSNLAHELSEIKYFWHTYKEIGKCAFDTKHVLYPDATRYRQIDAKTRQCAWCGRKETLHIEKEVITHEVWR
jgi:hypothetical protein